MIGNESNTPAVHRKVIHVQLNCNDIQQSRNSKSKTPDSDGSLVSSDLLNTGWFHPIFSSSFSIAKRKRTSECSSKVAHCKLDRDDGDVVVDFRVNPPRRTAMSIYNGSYLSMKFSGVMDTTTWSGRDPRSLLS